MVKRSCPFVLVVVLLIVTACQGSAAAQSITQGPILGAVTPDSVALWLRTAGAARVQIDYSRDALLQPGLSSEAVTTDAGKDFTTIVKISALEPQQTYYYNVRLNDVPQFSAPYPEFRTFPAEGDTAPFRFLVLTDFRTVSKINQNVDTYKNAARENPAFVIIGGDFDHRNPITLDDKRTMFRELYTPANGMQDFVNLILKKFPLVHFWDDHDFGDNNADKTYPDKNISLQVLQEYFPLYPITQYGDWQKFAYGNADFFVLDSRMQRDPPRGPDNPDKSMLDGDNLGAQGQREWLLNGLKNSRAVWKFIVTPVIFNATTKEFDGWAAYPDERKLILNYLDDNKISNVIFIAGDLHAGALDDGTNSGRPELVVPTASDGFDKRCLTEGTGNLGKWTVGIYADAGGSQCNGYGVIEVSPEKVDLMVKDSQGGTRFSYTVNKQ